MAVEERCYGDLAPAEVLRDGFEGEAFGGFGFEEDGREGGEAGDDGGLSGVLGGPVVVTYN